MRHERVNSRCVKCGGIAASLTTECPGRPLTAQEMREIEVMELDYKKGKWKHKKPRELDDEPDFKALKQIETQACPACRREGGPCLEPMGGAVRISCKDCGATGKSEFNVRDAILWWNGWAARVKRIRGDKK